MEDPFTAPQEPEKQSSKPNARTPLKWARTALPLTLAIILSVIVILLITRFQDQIENLKAYGYLGAFVIGFLGNATVIMPAPSLAFTAALGGVLNPFFVGIAAGTGEALGEITGYLAGLSGNAVIEDRVYYDTIHSYMDRHGCWVFFVLAAVPNPLFDVAGIVAGMVRFPLWKFLLSTWAGKTLKAIVFAGAGQQLLSGTRALPLNQAFLQ
jgi:membrane protein DedA with SNARE-associated domain